jgi:membrane associated rhomboid family serine protease
MNPYLVYTANQYYRFISSGFLHGDFSHLLWNMFSFYFFGTVVESYFSMLFGSVGAYYFVLFYLMAIVVSDIPSYFKHRKNPGYNSLGASGGVSAIIFVSIIFQPLQPICFYFVICLPGFILGFAYLIWSYFKSKNSNDNVNHEAHLYGAVFGIVFCAVMYPSSLLNFFEQLKGFKIF